jgi:glycosyltransferase involved in cell wall biosynthesis
MSYRNSSLRIALLIETDGAGGAERMVAQLALELEARGHSPVVFIPPRGEGWLERELKGSRVEVDHYWLDRPFDPGCARELAASFRNRDIDIAHSHEFTMAFYGAWASRLARIPHLVTMHGHNYYYTAMRRRLALRAAFMSSGATVSVSHALAGLISRELLWPRNRMMVIPNGVRFTPARTSTLRAELGMQEHDPVVVTVGSLYEVKGHRFLLEAQAQLSRRYPNLHVVIAGRGEQQNALSDLARQLDVESRVHLVGLRPDVANVVAAGDVFALPSLSEGLPLALLEAMFAARPIVASNVGDVAAVLDQGNVGLLVKPGDVSELARGIDRQLSDPTGAGLMGERAANRADAEYRVERMTSRYESLYRSLLGDRTLTGRPILARALSPS